MPSPVHSEFNIILHKTHKEEGKGYPPSQTDKSLCCLPAITFKPHYCNKPWAQALFLPLVLIKVKVASRVFWLLIKQNHSQITIVPQNKEPTPRAAAIRGSCSPALQVVLGETRSPGRIQSNKDDWRAAFSCNWLEGFTELSSYHCQPKHFIKQYFYKHQFARRGEFIYYSSWCSQKKQGVFSLRCAWWELTCKNWGIFRLRFPNRPSK